MSTLIKAGEASGKLDVFLLKLVESLEKKERIKKKIKGALTVPSGDVYRSNYSNGIHVN